MRTDHRAINRQQTVRSPAPGIARLLSLLVALTLAACSLNFSHDSVSANANPDNIENFYVVHGRRYAVLKSSTGFTQSGLASWYGDPFHGRKTANGEVYDMHLMTAAHKNLPLPTYVEVTNTLNGKRVVLRVNDRGPFIGERVIDLSYAAAKALDVVANGTAPVRIRALENHTRREDNVRIASTAQPAFIQLASFAEQANAQAYHQRLIAQGIVNTLIHQIRVENKGVVYRVQVGPIVNGTDYDRSIEQLRKIGINTTILIRE